MRVEVWDLVSLVNMEEHVLFTAHKCRTAEARAKQIHQLSVDD